MKKKFLSIFLFFIFSILMCPISVSANSINNSKNNIALDKIWTIYFNKEVNSEFINNDNIYILDSKGNKIEVILSILKDKKRVTVAPKENYYEGSTYTINIEKNLQDIYGKKLNNKLSMSFTTKKDDSLKKTNLSKYEKKNIQFTINKNIIKLETKNEDFKDLFIWVQFLNKKTQEKVNVDIQKFSKNGCINVDTSMLKKGTYYLNVYKSNERYSTFKSLLWKLLVLKKQKNSIGFEISPINEHNKSFFEKNNEVKEEHLSLKSYRGEYSSKVVELAQSITEGIENEYDKLLAIHDWVCENIYYDYDAYYNDSSSWKTIDEILEEKKGVCANYSELTAALLRTIGIPCRIVSGYALNSSTDRLWTPELINSTLTNHAWNEAYVDNRWVILDTTWNTFNKYKNGKYEKGYTRHIYFDPTLEFFSLSHKIIDRE